MQIPVFCYHMGSQPPGPDINGPVYWRAKLGEGKHNPKSVSQLFSHSSAPFSQLELGDVLACRPYIFKGMERNCELLHSRMYFPSDIWNANDLRLKMKVFYDAGLVV